MGIKLSDIFIKYISKMSEKGYNGMEGQWEK